MVEFLQAFCQRVSTNSCQGDPKSAVLQTPQVFVVGLGSELLSPYLVIALLAIIIIIITINVSLSLSLLLIKGTMKQRPATRSLVGGGAVTTVKGPFMPGTHTVGNCMVATARFVKNRVTTRPDATKCR